MTALAGLALCSADTSALAQGSGQVVVDPPKAKHRSRPPQGLKPAEVSVRLRIAYQAAKIFNPLAGKDGREDIVCLRSYIDEAQTIAKSFASFADCEKAVKAAAVRPARRTKQGPARDTPFVAPTIEVLPGQTLKIALHNALAPEPGCGASKRTGAPRPTHDVNTPHCFNTTNLHTHGLWVSPEGKSDNVMMDIEPGKRFEHEYKISDDHAAGTFWYHPHKHGSVAVQVSSGMVGALIVKGNRVPTASKNGDIDTLLKHVAPAVEEKILLLQQIAYGCRDAAVPGGQVPKLRWDCRDDDVGGIEPASNNLPQFEEYFGGGTWKASERFTTVNGDLQPVVEAVGGRIMRWRVLHGGVRETVNLVLREALAGASEELRKLRTADARLVADAIKKYCPGDNLSQFALASDGLTRAKIVERKTSYLQPGYREDVLVVFPKAGDYCIIDDEQEDAEANVGNARKSRKFLGMVTVKNGAPITGSLKDYIRDALARAALSLPADVRTTVRADLMSPNGLLLTKFVPHESLEDANGIEPGPKLELQMLGGEPKINGEPYNPGDDNQTIKLVLGKKEEWVIKSKGEGHPFHIHVNPFQITKITNRAGELKIDGDIDGEDAQYSNLKGVWRDTLFIKHGYTAYVRMHYRRYTGDFVLHCHILHHEDRGMMRKVTIDSPEGLPKRIDAVPGAHRH